MQLPGLTASKAARNPWPAALGQDGPDKAQHLTGEVTGMTGEVTGLLLTGGQVPATYISGDNASLDVVCTTASLQQQRGSI